MFFETSFFVVGVGKLHLSEMQVVNRTRYCKDATLKQSTHEKDFFSIRLSDGDRSGTLNPGFFKSFMEKWQVNSDLQTS